MMLPDVNVLVYAFRGESPRHRDYRAWLESLMNGDAAYGIADLACSGFLRIVTHPRTFDPPAPVALALDFVNRLRDKSNCVVVSPGPRHWQIFSELCVSVNARGNIVPDAYFAALAIESGNEWVTTDRDYSRFPGLRWRHPLQ